MLLITLPIFLLLLIGGATSATFTIHNNCSYTVWAAASPGGGRQLDSGRTWTLDVAAGTSRARIWARTGCSFDEAGRGRCQTGDCNGVLECRRYGQGPNTLVEYTLNQSNNLDFYDVSVLDGFNVPLEFSPTSGGCDTRPISCTADINSRCPADLRVPGGCNNPCRVFVTEQYCCRARPDRCQPTYLSEFFKERCPDAYSYPMDDETSTFTCPAGTNYSVVFCPGENTPVTVRQLRPYNCVSGYTVEM